MSNENEKQQTESVDQAGKSSEKSHSAEKPHEANPKEIGGRKGPEPTRYGDWEKNGRCIDF